MIPKIIHYCWFGGKPLPELAKKCIDSWKKYCPDYEIVEWNESNYDINKNSYISEAYEAKKWAFVSDYARLDIVYNYGGIYLDIDVEIIKPIDSFLNDQCFFAEEKKGLVATGIGFAAEKNHHAVKMMLQQYDGVHFKLGKDMYDTTPCPYRNTRALKRLGYKSKSEINFFDSVVVYPKEYFCPITYETGELEITENTVAIHHFNESWIDRKEKEFEKKIDDYRKSHSRINSLIYKNCYEYKLQHESFEIRSVFVFIWKKVRKKVMRLLQIR